MAATGNRPARVAERVRVELTELLMRGEVRDPAAANVVITAVTITKDLSIARVYVRALDDAGAKRQKEIVAAMERAKGFLRRALGGRLEIRHTPDLEFFWDETADRAARIEELLEEVRNEPKEPE